VNFYLETYERHCRRSGGSVKAGKCVAIFASLALGASTGIVAAQNSNLRVIRPAGSTAAAAPYSPGVLADETLYMSGQGSLKADGTRPPEFDQQVKQALRNVRGVLQAANMDFGNVVWMNVYLTNSNDIAEMNKIYWQNIGPNPPARTVLVVSALANQEKIEINCIAVSSVFRRRVIWPKGWPRGAHIDPPGIQAGDVLYLSAQSGADPLSGKIGAAFGDEVKQSLDNVATILAAAKMSMKNVLWVNPYMSAGVQSRTMNSVYKTYFEFGNTPGRGTIQVMALPNGSHIVFSCIAGADLSKRKAIRPRNMPPSPTASPGILYGNTLYLSAKDGFIPGQGMVTPDFNLQLRQSMRNLLDGLQEANMDFSNVVFSTVYLRQIQDYSRMNDLYQAFFKSAFPARTTLQQNDDYKAEDTEQISFIAVKTSSH
jgi:reactive intermediate/imine deaminase